MAAATKAINSPERPGKLLYLPLAAATVIYAGTLVALDSNGRAVPAADTAGLRVVGLAQETVDNSAGSAAALSINVKPGIFRMNNSATDAVDTNDVGKLCFVEDDNTVNEAGASDRVIAGRVVEVDSEGVWVEVGHESRIVPTVVTLTSTNGTMAAAADDAAVKVEGEKIGDDVRAIHAALVTAGIIATA